MKVLNLALIFTMIGCAANSYVLKQQELLPYKESSQITKLNQENKTIWINSIVDQRNTKDLGFAYTGVEYKKTPVYTDIPVEELIKNHLSSSFQVRNIEVLEKGELELNIFLKEVYVNEVIEKHKPERAYCKLGLDFKINGKMAKWNGSYWTEFTSAGDLSDGTERLAPTLASCMNELVEKVMNDEKFVAMLGKTGE